MSEVICYTASELFNKKLLLKTDLTPVTSLSQVQKILAKHATKAIASPHGMARVFTQDEVVAYNKKIAEFAKREMVTITPDMKFLSPKSTLSTELSTEV